MRKRAQSEIITTILLILIVLAAIVVVWIVVTRFIRPVTESPLCLEVRLDIAKAVDNGTGMDYVTITRMAGGSDDDVTGIKFLVNGEVKYPTHINGGQCPGTETDPCNALYLGNLTQLQTKTFQFAADTISIGDEVKVAALVTSEQRICDPITSKRAA